MGPWSTITLDQGLRRTGSGFRRSAEVWCEVFPLAHTGQAAMIALVLWTIDSHQKPWHRR